MKLNGHLHIVTWLRMSGAIPPFPVTSSWRGTYLSTGTLRTLPCLQLRSPVTDATGSFIGWTIGNIK
jgi:hypothetical protein